MNLASIAPGLAARRRRLALTAMLFTVLAMATAVCARRPSCGCVQNDIESGGHAMARDALELEVGRQLRALAFYGEILEDFWPAAGRKEVAQTPRLAAASAPDQGPPAGARAVALADRR